MLQDDYICNHILKYMISIYGLVTWKILQRSDQIFVVTLQNLSEFFFFNKYNSLLILRGHELTNFGIFAGIFIEESEYFLLTRKYLFINTFINTCQC